MATVAPHAGLIRRWVLANTLGWFLGLVLLLAVGSLWSLFAPDAQFMVGFTIGAGVGYFQARVLRPWLGRLLPWTLASSVALGALFLLSDLLRFAGVDSPYSLPAFTLAGAVGAAVWQSRLLARISPRAGLWIPACILGWALPVACIFLGGRQGAGEVAAATSVGAILFGGVLLGGVTGWALPRILPSE